MNLRVRADFWWTGEGNFTIKVLDYCQRNNIKMYSVSSCEIKASIAETVIQTIKRK